MFLKRFFEGLPQCVRRRPANFGLAAALAVALACPSAWALDAAAAQALAHSSGCMSCHAVAEKVVGPAFASVAAKYRGDASAAALVQQSIQNGARGKWGRVAMPAHPSLSAADAKALAKWVLSVP